MANIVETQHALPHGIRLNCRHSGQPGRPVLLFLHGFPEGAFAWDALLDHFSQPENGGFFCVAPNLRGFETSSTPADPAAYRAKFLVQDILALIDIVSPVKPWPHWWPTTGAALWPGTWPINTPSVCSDW